MNVTSLVPFLRANRSQVLKWLQIHRGEVLVVGRHFCGTDWEDDDLWQDACVAALQVIAGSTPIRQQDFPLRFWLAYVCHMRSFCLYTWDRALPLLCVQLASASSLDEVRRVISVIFVSHLHCEGLEVMEELSVDPANAAYDWLMPLNPSIETLQWFALLFSGRSHSTTTMIEASRRHANGLSVVETK